MADVTGYELISYSLMIANLRRRPIASAVVLPEATAPKAASKRRQSSASDSTPKRPRQSLDANSHTPNPPHEPPPPTESSDKEPATKREDGVKDRRKSSVQEERKRGQRLFGGLLSTLSQSTPNGQQKRRLEIEKRQSERAKQQKDSDEARRRERLADFKIVLKSEQVIYNEAEYYAPWKLLPGQEGRIKKQIAVAEATIEHEISQFDLRYPERPGRKETKTEKADTKPKETPGEPLTESPSVSKVDDTTDPPETQAPQSEQSQEAPRAQEEHNGEVVVENDEDTVIY
ncbi:hypothetical protein PZA11_004625 [Diplocarpon coronariae]